MGLGHLHRSAILARVPLALAAALVVGACIVPGLDPEFHVDELGASSGTTSSGGTTSSNGGTTTSSGNDGTTSSTTSSGSTGTTSSTTSSGSTTDGGSIADAGKDATKPPTTFCGSAPGTAIFCSDFSEPNPLATGLWKKNATTGTVTFDLLPDPHVHAVVNAAPEDQNPGASIFWVVPAAKLPGNNQLIRLTAKIVLDNPSTTYANLVLITVNDIERGLALTECSAGGGMCLVENDRGSKAANAFEQPVGAGTFDVVVNLTHVGANWASAVLANNKTLASRTNDAILVNAAGEVRAVVGTANAGSNGSSTGVKVDNVLVEVLTP